MATISNLDVVKYLLFKEHYHRPVFLRTNFRILICAIFGVYFLSQIVFNLPIIYFNLFAQVYNYETGVCQGSACLDKMCYKDDQIICYIFGGFLITFFFVVIAITGLFLWIVSITCAKISDELRQMNGRPLWNKIYNVLIVKRSLPYIMDNYLKILAHFIILITLVWMVPQNMIPDRNIDYETGKCIAESQKCPHVSCWKGNYYGCKFYSFLVISIMYVTLLCVGIICENICVVFKHKLIQIKHDIQNGNN
jgi:hypothetical protein